MEFEKVLDFYFFCEDFRLQINIFHPSEMCVLSEMYIAV